MTVVQLFTELEPFLFDPNFAPLMAHNLTDLPPAYVVTCEYDILRDDGRSMWRNRECGSMSHMGPMVRFLERITQPGLVY